MTNISHEHVFDYRLAGLRSLLCEHELLETQGLREHSVAAPTHPSCRPLNYYASNVIAELIINDCLAEALDVAEAALPVWALCESGDMLGSAHAYYIFTKLNMALCRFETAKTAYDHAKQMQVTTINDEGLLFSDLLLRCFPSLDSSRSLDSNKLRSDQQSACACFESGLEYYGSFDRLGGNSNIFASGNYGAIREHFQITLRIRRKALGDDDPRVGECLRVISEMCYKLCDYKSAKEYGEAALRLYLSASVDYGHNILRCHISLALTMLELGDIEEGIRYCVIALREGRRIYGSRSSEVADCLTTLADLNCCRGKYNKAERQARAAIKIKKQLFGSSHIETIDSLQALANILFWNMNYTAASSLYEDITLIMKEAYPKEHLDIARALARHGLVQLALRRYGQAKQLYLRAHAMWCDAGYYDARPSRDCIMNIAFIQYKLGETKKAFGIFKNLLNLIKRIPDSIPDELFYCLIGLCNVALDLGDYSYHDACSAEADEIVEPNLRAPSRQYLRQAVEWAEIIIQKSEDRVTPQRRRFNDR